jgi:hypothetical protein
MERAVWTRSIASDLTSALADCNAVIQLTQQDASPLDSHGLIYLKQDSGMRRAPITQRR